MCTSSVDTDSFIALPLVKYHIKKYDERWRNAPGIFRKASDFFLISDLYRVDTEIAEGHVDIARSFLKPIIPLLPYGGFGSEIFKVYTIMLAKLRIVHL